LLLYNFRRRTIKQQFSKLAFHNKSYPRQDSSSIPKSHSEESSKGVLRTFGRTCDLWFRKFLCALFPTKYITLFQVRIPVLFRLNNSHRNSLNSDFNRLRNYYPFTEKYFNKLKLIFDVAEKDGNGIGSGFLTKN